ncbi:MAG: DEAD/DEAH box helicase family protein [Balneolaceae bacterium]
MKIKFNPNLDFQEDAINSVTKVFEGQEIGNSHFTVSGIPETEFQFEETGISNKLKLLEEDLLKNVQSVQIENGLKPDEKLNEGLDFTIEMETGTGKTYVYLRSMFELYKKYGFSKFIIVVPSVAIREGVYKSLQMTEEHFRQIYDNTPYDYFIYDSDKLGQVRSFATSQHIQIMVINIDAFRKSFTDPSKMKKANIIHRPHDRMTGQKPIEYIQSTNPVVIIDEPQTVDTTNKSAKAIASLNPLCTFRYSATHIDKYHMLYKLDSVDAYERKLVKQIEVAGIQVDDAHNKAFVKVHEINNKKGRPEATISLDQFKNGKVSRVKRRVSSGEDLFEMSGGREVYDGYIISELYAEKGNEYVRFSNDVIVRQGLTIGGVDEDRYKRLQIRKTIDEHLDKELRLRPKGIKVLSLFFIDRVSNYRIYNEDGIAQNGKYAKMFEEEYQKTIRSPKYNSLFEGVDKDTIAEKVHDGYFSIDTKGRGSNKKEFFVDTTGETQADGDAYNLIMKDKERLLDLDTKLKFIFSHSTLREGWDNPNVFQICTLNETGSTIKKRQEIGRGLRIAVNQDGERVHGFDVNTLTVLANESYEDFAKQLQKEIEEEEGIHFGVVEPHSFAGIPILDAEGETRSLGVDLSEKVWNHLLDEEYINEKGKIQDKLRLDIKADVVNLPEDVADQKSQITSLLRKLAGKLNIQNADDKKIVKFKKEVLLDDDFKQLWDKIKYKTTYRVDFDAEKLMESCAKALRDQLRVSKARFRYETSKLKIDRGGVQTGEANQQIQTYDAKDFPLPDVLTILQDETQLTRKSLARMLIDSGRLSSFTNNPQKFIEQAVGIIKSQMRMIIVDGIKYHKIGDDHFYAQELFENKEIFGYLNKNMIEADKSVYDHVVYDSDIERNFAEAFERNEGIKLYAKLPDWFKIDTPLGSYNPDWAVVYEQNGDQKLYFVVETKGSLFSDALRATESAKIECGRQHFKAMESGVAYEVADDFDRFLDVVGG